MNRNGRTASACQCLPFETLTHTLLIDLVNDKASPETRNMSLQAALTAAFPAEVTIRIVSERQTEYSKGNSRRRQSIGVVEVKVQLTVATVQGFLTGAAKTTQTTLNNGTALNSKLYNTLRATGNFDDLVSVFVSMSAASGSSGSTSGTSAGTLVGIVAGVMGAVIIVLLVLLVRARRRRGPSNKVRLFLEQGMGDREGRESWMSG